MLTCTYYIMQAIHNVNKNTHIKWDNVDSGKDRRYEDEKKTMKKKKLRFGYNTRINSK